MIVRCVKSAFVSAALLAALATSCGTASANPASQNAEMVRAAYSELRNGNAEAAIEKFSKAIESRAMEPEVLANALLNRALAYQQTGKHEAAVEDYTAAIALDAMSPSLRATALHNRGLSQHKLQNLTAAIEDFTTSLLLMPNSPHAFYNRGNALRDSRQYLFALSDFERALRNKHPDTARVLYASANTYIALNRPEDAKKALNAALLANPDFGQARAQLVLLGDENAKLQQAESDPILTGSVSALAGGTLVTKPVLPKAVEPPAEPAVATLAKSKKLFLDRVPAEVAATAPAEMTLAAFGPEEVVEVEQVPEIPPPVKPAKAKKIAKNMPAAVEADENASVADVEQDPVSADPTAARGWSVQIASAASEDAAWSTWKKMQARYKVLKSLKPLVVRADLGTKGVFYRVRIGGFEDQNAANKACSKYKSGGVNCYISRVDG
jgi:tetratricopeptide (TPR) repeat protein